MTTFTEALSTARRKSRLVGRPLSRGEVSGISSGFAEAASLRLSRQKSLSLQEREIGQRETLQTRAEEATAERQTQAEASERERQAERIRSTEEMEASRLEEIRITRKAQQAAARRAEEAAEVSTGAKVATGVGVAVAGGLAASQLVFAGGLALGPIGIIGAGIILGIAAIAGK